MKNRLLLGILFSFGKDTVILNNHGLPFSFGLFSRANNSLSF